MPTSRVFAVWWSPAEVDGTSAEADLLWGVFARRQHAEVGLEALAIRHPERDRRCWVINHFEVGRHYWMEGFETTYDDPEPELDVTVDRG